MWSLMSPWCSEHKKSLVSELPDDFSHSLHHLLSEGYHPNPNEKKAHSSQKKPPFGRK